MKPPLPTSLPPDPGTSAGAPASALGQWIRAQAVNLSRHAQGLREFGKGEFGTGVEAPSDGHVSAVNTLLRRLRPGLALRSQKLAVLARKALAQPSAGNLSSVVTHKHQAHDRVRHVEKIWDFYFELFGQRQSPFGKWLTGCDRVALDCYQAAYTGIGIARSVPAPPPFSYMRTGFGPATFRRGIPVSFLGREKNPFPLVQLPYHRMLNPWTLGAVLHEVSHNIQSDLGLSKAVPLAMARQLLKHGIPSSAAQIWTRWNREIFADLSGLLQGGPGVVPSLMDVVGRSPEIVYAYDPRGVHPVPYLRVLLSCELLGRMGFPREAQAWRTAWCTLYPGPRQGGLPALLLHSAPAAMRHVVEAVCYQPYAALGGKALSEVFRFGPKDQVMVREAAGRLAAGTDPGIVPARFLIGAVRFAFDERLAPPAKLREAFYTELARR